MENLTADAWAEKLAPIMSDLDAVRNERDALRAEVANMHSRLEAAGIEADHFKEKFEQAVRGAKERESELRKELDALAVERRSTTADAGQWQQRCQTLETQIKKERETFFKQEQELMQISEKHRIRADAERVERVKLAEQLENVHTEIAARDQALEEGDENLRSRDKELRLLRHETDILRARTEEAVRVESDAKDELAQLQLLRNQENVEYEARLQKAEHELNRISALLADAVKEREKSEFQRQEETKALEWKIEKQVREVEDSRRLVAEEQERGRGLQAGLAEARHDFSDLQTRYEKLERKYFGVADVARTDHLSMLSEIRANEKELAEIREKSRENEKQLASERRFAGAQIDQLQTQLRNAMLIAQREKDELVAEVTELRMRAEAVALRESGFEQEIAAVREEGEKQAEALREELAAKVSALQQVTGAFQDETRRTQVLEDQIASHRNLLEEMERRMREWQAAAHAREKEFAGRETHWQEKVAEQQTRQTTLKSERDALALSLQAVKEKENTTRLSLREMRDKLAEMEESVAASAASKAFHKEKMENLEAALDAAREELQITARTVADLQEQALNDRENYRTMEAQLKETHMAELQDLNEELSRAQAAQENAVSAAGAAREEAAKALADERQRNQELLQNLLAMRDELENAQSASVAGKNFLKEKLQRAEDELVLRRSELAQERARRQEIEFQLRDLRQKMEFA